MFIKDLPEPFFVLAPMDDVTDTVFRQIVSGTSKPDLFFTEFVNVDGLQSPGRKQLIRKLKFSSKEKPIVAQIWGKNPENYQKTARELVDMGFSGIDINMGCPVKTVVRNGCCVALINNRELAQSIIEATKKGADGKLPVSVKTRIGFNDVDMTWIEFLLKQQLDMLTVHGRTAKQMSKAEVNWPAINEARQLRDKLSPKTKLVANGDIVSRQQGLELARKYKLDGLMIGRGIFTDPFVFSETSPWAEYPRDERIRLFSSHVKLFEDTWGEAAKPVYSLNKFCKIYIQGFDGAKELREACMNAGSTKQLLLILDKALVQ